MGYATTRSFERVLASCGMLAGALLEFVAADDVPQAGVLCALPALLAEGLLRHTRTFYSLPAGFYPLESLFLYMALLALVRCRSLEATRYEAPGEWGCILGLDRLPEVKTRRKKIAHFCKQEGVAAQWQSQLAKEWMGAAQEDEEGSAAGLFYVDGHVRLYHGKLTPLPRRYVATSPGSGSVCGAPPITGSTDSGASPFSSSPRRLTRASSPCCASRSSRDCSKTRPRPQAAECVSRLSSTARGIRPNSLANLKPRAWPSSPMTSFAASHGRARSLPLVR